VRGEGEEWKKRGRKGEGRLRDGFGFRGWTSDMTNYKMVAWITWFI